MKPPETSSVKVDITLVATLTGAATPLDDAWKLGRIEVDIPLRIGYAPWANPAAAPTGGAFLHDVAVMPDEVEMLKRLADGLEEASREMLRRADRELQWRHEQEERAAAEQAAAAALKAGGL